MSLFLNLVNRCLLSHCWSYPLKLALNEIFEKHLVDLALVVARALMAYQFWEIHENLSSEVIKLAVTPS